MNRRRFVSNLLSSLALCAKPIYIWGAAKRFGSPDLTIGLLSDIHITLGPDTHPMEATRLFRHALEYFRERHVDGVLISGDLTHLGLELELKAVADAWFSVFPCGKLPDGSPVANLMHYGDHDAETRFYSERLKMDFAKAGVSVPRSLSQGELRKELWEAYFKESWSPLRHVRVKGYDFILSNFMREGSMSAPKDLAERLAALKLDPKRPFFYSQHRYIGGTYLADEEMWGHDNGVARKVLALHPNCIAFTGHTHYMLTDDRNVWMGDFICINNGALKDAPVGRMHENGMDIPWYKTDSMRDTQMPQVNPRQGHHGMVMSLFGDVAVLERRDFGCDMSLGPDLVFSISPKDRSHFSAAELKNNSAVPAFPANEKISVVRGMGKNRRGEPVEQISIEFSGTKVEKSCSRAFDYVVRATRSNGAILKEKRVYSPGVNLPPEKDTKSVKCVFAVSELASGVVRFTVVPANCWHVEGRPVSISTVI